MKRDPKLVVNGYRVPGGLARIAVAAAVDLIKQRPGVRQAEVLKHAVTTSGLNGSTASWITSPVKGPCGHLWDRRGQPFRCHPNEGTEQFDLDPIDLSISYTKAKFADETEHLRAHLQPGNIFQGRSRHYDVDGPFLFISHAIISMGRLRHSAVITFNDISALDDRSLYGRGIPSFGVVGISSGKQVTVPVYWLRAQPLGT